MLKEDVLLFVNSEAKVQRYPAASTGERLWCRVSSLKASSESTAVSMSVLTNAAEYAVAALPEIEGALVTFTGGNHKTYTLHYASSNEDKELLLWDLNRDTRTPLTSATAYRFTCNGQPEQFRIVSPEQTQADDQSGNNDPNVEKFILNQHLYIRRAASIYTVLGYQSGTDPFW